LRRNFEFELNRWRSQPIQLESATKKRTGRDQSVLRCRFKLEAAGLARDSVQI
jgi:hypothetical protein